MVRGVLQSHAAYLPWRPTGSGGYPQRMTPIEASPRGNSYSNGPTPYYADLNHPPEIYNGLTAPR